jgi:hypothetical protein
MEPEAVVSFLGSCGWRVVEHLGGDEVAERYEAPPGRRLAPAPVIERMVYAEKL